LRFVRAVTAFKTTVKIVTDLLFSIVYLHNEQTRGQVKSKVANLRPQSILTVVLNVVTALTNLKGLTLTPI